MTRATPPTDPSADAAPDAFIDAFVACVGDELLGERADANGPFITRELLGRGIRTARLVVLRDELRDIAEAVRAAAARHAIVVLSGGLGPTDDDVTREAIACALDLPLEEDGAVRAALEERSRAAGREAPAAGFLRQALAPRGAGVIANPVGSAPSLVVPSERGAVIALPGPPHELRAHFPEALDRALAVLGARGLAVPEALHRAVLTLGGIGESDAAERVADALEVNAVKASWLCIPGEVRLWLSSPSYEAVRAAADACRARLGGAVVSDDGRGAAELIVATLAERFETVTAAESFTGGLVASALTGVPGASQVLKASFVTYSAEAKHRILGVPAAVLEGSGVVSEACALAMAAGARRAAESDFALATTGVAGPGGGSEETPVGSGFIALAHADGAVEARAVRFSGDREAIRQRTAAACLDMLRRALLVADGS